MHKVTPEDVEAEIIFEQYVRGSQACTQAGILENDILDKATICFMILRGGWVVIGRNAGPVDPNAFDPEMGKRMARKDAIDQIWHVLGYQLHCRIGGDAVFRASKEAELQRLRLVESPLDVEEAKSRARQLELL